MQRRRFLGAVGAGAVGLAGCTSAGSDGGGGGGAGGDGDGTWSLPDHASLTDVGSDGTEPWLGPPPGEAPGLVVAFEDPSCTLCGRFERRTFPELQSQLIESGQLTFVYRVYPIVYEWGKPATQALEATLAAESDDSERAFWALKAHYYAEQEGFDTGNVLDRTESFLASETDVDAAAVVSAAEAKAHDDRVQADLAAGNEAGVSSTPTFFLFRDGSYRTKVTGAQSYSVFETTLGF
jgi:protein-disulfide isomerase